MGTSPVLLRFLKTWALLLLLLQVASLPAFSHGISSKGAQEGVHAQGHCEGRVGGFAQIARACCALPALAEAKPVLSECGSPCCRRRPEARAAFEGGTERVGIGSGVMTEVGFEQGSAGCCCAIKVDFPLLQPVVPPTSAPSGGMAPELSWTAVRIGPGFTRRCWDPQLVGEARILASVRAQMGACRVVHRVEGEAVEVLHCSFLL